MAGPARPSPVVPPARLSAGGATGNLFPLSQVGGGCRAAACGDGPVDTRGEETPAGGVRFPAKGEIEHLARRSRRGEPVLFADGKDLLLRTTGRRMRSAPSSAETGMFR